MFRFGYSCVLLLAFCQSIQSGVYSGGSVLSELEILPAKIKIDDFGIWVLSKFKMPERLETSELQTLSQLGNSIMDYLDETSSPEQIVIPADKNPGKLGIEPLIIRIQIPQLHETGIKLKWSTGSGKDMFSYESASESASKEFGIKLFNKSDSSKYITIKSMPFLIKKVESRLSPESLAHSENEATITSDSKNVFLLYMPSGISANSEELPPGKYEATYKASFVLL